MSFPADDDEGDVDNTMEPIILESGIERCLKCDNLLYLGRGKDHRIYYCTTATCTCPKDITRKMSDEEIYDAMTFEDDFCPPQVTYTDI